MGLPFLQSGSPVRRLDLDGFAVLQDIRAMDRGLPSLPIVALTVDVYGGKLGLHALGAPRRSKEALAQVRFGEQGPRGREGTETRIPPKQAIVAAG
jgi:hypothetical protein